MTPEIAKDTLRQRLSANELPERDSVVCTTSGFNSVQTWTFIGLIKVAYNLTEAGEQKGQSHG